MSGSGWSLTTKHVTKHSRTIRSSSIKFTLVAAVAVAAALLPPPPAATAAVKAAAAEAAAIAAAASDKSPRGESVLNEFPCNKFPSF